MHSYAVVCIAVLMLIGKSDCRLHRRSHLLRRQNEQVFQNPNQMIPYFYQMQPASSQFPQNYQNPAGANSGFQPLPYPAMPPMFSSNQAPNAYPGINSNLPFNAPPVASSTSLQPSPQYPNSNFQNSSQYQNPPAASTRRRKKNVTSDNRNAVENLLEKGKKILERHPLGLGKEIDDSLGVDNEMDKNTTVIPIAKGVQVKTISDQDENHIEKIVNISSTQRTLFVDNNTEIENVVEMQMEKKLEDEKGDNKGSEEVRIVETELVKPVDKMKLSNTAQGTRHRRFHTWKFPAHRRSKRSVKDSGVARPSSIYTKMAKRFLSDLKRKGRITERDTILSQQQGTSDSEESEFTSMKSKVKDVGSGKSVKDDSLYYNDELGDFLKHFLDELKKFKRIRENIGNKAQHVEFSNSSDSHNFKQTKPARKNRHHVYPEYMNIVMNLNMTLDTKTKDHLVRSQNAPHKLRNYDVSMKATGKPVESTIDPMTLKVMFIKDGKESDTKFLTALLLLSVLVFIIPISAWILPKFYRMARLSPRNSADRFYHENGREKAKGLSHFRPEKLCNEDYPQLEWQSENGDWLSDKEMEFK